MKRRTSWIAGACAIAGAALAGLSAQDHAARSPRAGPPAALGLVPSFREEFDSAALDEHRWIFAYYDPTRDQPGIAKRTLWGNRELQVYADRSFLSLGIDPFTMRNGVLTITANPLSPAQLATVQEAIGREPPKIRDSAIRNVRYSSGMISTRGRFAQTYGYFEIRTRWSSGKGVWPAFWLLPSNGKWPPEIDVLEAHGDKPATTFHSVHSTVAASVTKKGARANDTGFHVYGALWTPATIDYFVDGAKVATIPTPADMNQPMHLIANLAIGGRWPGNPDASTRFPASIEIDYIRVWRFATPP
ncbi:family 16 glycosylhydrolase [Sphingomonas sp. S2-65]|uniref:glycoside hydrolase family 16 protein n=1 Tax=Sphingomonas sp. S2-65 TaxID=2903960 RepID=UPI001F3B74FE|nr:glycoside hydrolase family 16 protein [Sphingomonas sp. S2-65]UYY57046.1 glycoside hydrolase family 16 protein [Sphingomonas sp. S2-65]